MRAGVAFVSAESEIGVDAAENEQVRVLNEECDPIIAAIVALRAHTPEGLFVKAGVVALHEVRGVMSLDAPYRDSPDENVMTSLLNDLLVMRRNIDAARS